MPELVGKKFEILSMYRESLKDFPAPDEGGAVGTVLAVETHYVLVEWPVIDQWGNNQRSWVPRAAFEKAVPYAVEVSGDLT